MDNNVAAMWERLEAETNRSFAAFQVFLDLGHTRSLRRAGEVFYDAETGLKPSQLNQFKEWSSKHRWQQRAAAWDGERRRQNHLKRQEDAENARDRALRSAQMVQAIAIRGLWELHDDIRGPVLRPPIELLRYWRESIEAEFLALGLPVSVIKQQIEEPDPEEVAEQQRIQTYGRAVSLLEGGRPDGRSR